MTYNVGVIGAGVWGCHSLERELIKTGKAKIVSVCASEEFGANCFEEGALRKAREYANELNAEFVADWRELLESPQINIVSVMTSPKVKAEIICRALKNGKHVVTDKPLGMNADEVEKIIKAEKDAGVKGFMLAGYHIYPGVKKIIRKIQDGAFGEIKALSLRLNFMGGIFPGFKPSTQWRSEIPSGEMTTIGSHAIITALKIINSQAKEAYAELKNDFYQEYADVKAEDWGRLNLKFNSGAIANITVGRIPHQIPDEDIMIEVTGTEGYAHLKGTRLELWPEGEITDCSFDRREVQEEVFDQFIDSLPESVSPPTTFFDGYELQKILDAAFLSAKKQITCRIPVSPELTAHEDIL